MVLACLPVHCCVEPSLLEGCKQRGVGQVGVGAGGPALRVVSEWRKRWMADVTAGCGGAEGRVGVAGARQGAEPGQTESCIRVKLVRQSAKFQQPKWTGQTARSAFHGALCLK